MLRALRRSRLLAFTLALLTPGLAGAAVQALHPCPAEAPWLAQPAGHHGHGSGHHGGDPPADGAPADCHCIGACDAGSGWAPGRAPDVPGAAVAPLARHGHGPSRGILPARPAHLLPPSTAPPTG